MRRNYLLVLVLCCFFWILSFFLAKKIFTMNLNNLIKHWANDHYWYWDARDIYTYVAFYNFKICYWPFLQIFFLFLKFFKTQGMIYFILKFQNKNIYFDFMILFIWKLYFDFMIPFSILGCPVARYVEMRRVCVAFKSPIIESRKKPLRDTESKRASYFNNATHANFVELCNVFLLKSIKKSK